MSRKEEFDALMATHGKRTPMQKLRDDLAQIEDPVKKIMHIAKLTYGESSADYDLICMARAQKMTPSDINSALYKAHNKLSMSNHVLVRRLRRITGDLQRRVKNISPELENHVFFTTWHSNFYDIEEELRHRPQQKRAITYGEDPEDDEPETTLLSYFPAKSERPETFSEPPEPNLEPIDDFAKTEKSTLKKIEPSAKLEPKRDLKPVATNAAKKPKPALTPPRRPSPPTSFNSAANNGATLKIDITKHRINTVRHIDIPPADITKIPVEKREFYNIARQAAENGRIAPLGLYVFTVHQLLPVEDGFMNAKALSKHLGINNKTILKSIKDVLPLLTQIFDQNPDLDPEVKAAALDYEARTMDGRRHDEKLRLIKKQEDVLAELPTPNPDDIPETTRKFYDMAQKGVEQGQLTPFGLYAFIHHQILTPADGFMDLPLIAKTLGTKLETIKGHLFTTITYLQEKFSEAEWGETLDYEGRIERYAKPMQNQRTREKYRGKETESLPPINDEDFDLSNEEIALRHSFAIRRDILSARQSYVYCYVRLAKNKKKMSDIAKELGISRDTVNAHLTQATQRIRDAIILVHAERENDMTLGFNPGEQTYG